MTVRPDASGTNDKTLFGDSLLDSTVGERKSRTWATLVSLVLQCLVIGFALLLPLWFTQALPKQQLLTFLEAPPPPPPPPPPAAATPRVKVVKVTSDVVDGRLRTPSRIPAKVQVIKEDEAPPPVAASSGGVVGGVPGGIPGGQLGGVIGGIIGSGSSLAPVPTLSKSLPQRVRVSQGVVNGLLVSRVDPTYPSVAMAARIEGTVILKAIIDKQGNVQNLQLLKGHPLLAPAAIAAVKQWRYKPFRLNGEPVEIETTITVNFQMQSS